MNNSYEEFKSEDPQEIVIDEVVGQMLVLLAIPVYETLYPLPFIYYCLVSFLFLGYLIYGNLFLLAMLIII